MSAQNYENHRHFVKGWHLILASVILLTVIGSTYHLVRQWGSDFQYITALMVATNVALLVATFYSRVFALGAQDRVIRLEEELRSQKLNGRGLDARLTLRQIIGLRFASDEEWNALSERAISENMSEDDIKKAVQNWRSDTCRL